MVARSMETPSGGSTPSSSAQTTTEQTGGTTTGRLLRDLILGSQDGLVNVLGLVLGVASATTDTRLILISGLAATFAESISMGAVAYTSSKAEEDFYRGMLARERRQIEEIPERAREDIRVIYARKGFSGEDLDSIVDTITADTKLWLDTMMLEELRLSQDEHASPAQQGLVVGGAAVAGSLIPIGPFVWLATVPAMVVSVALSVAILFAIGAVKARVTGHGGWRKNGVEMAVIGTLAAIAGYVIGLLLGGTPS